MEGLHPCLQEKRERRDSKDSKDGNDKDEEMEEGEVKDDKRKRKKREKKVNACTRITLTNFNLSENFGLLIFMEEFKKKNKEKKKRRNTEINAKSETANCHFVVSHPVYYMILLRIQFFAWKENERI